MRKPLDDLTIQRRWISMFRQESEPAGRNYHPMCKAQRIMWFFFALNAFSVLAASSATACQLSGSDLGLGVGARAITMGGAFAAVADDASALYWNPAGLTSLDGTATLFQLEFPGSVYLQQDGGEILIEKDWIVSYAAIAGAFAWHDHTIGWGLAYNKRLVFYVPEVVDFSGSSLAAFLPIPEGFTGSMYTTTDGYKAELAISPAFLPALSIGLNVEYVYCYSDYDHVDPTQSQQVIGDGFVADLGLLYRFNDRLALGVKLGHIYNDLRTRVTHGDGTVTDNRNPLHREYTIGLSYRSDRWIWACDYEFIFGEAPFLQDVDIQMLRLGCEYRASAAWTWRAGIVLPTHAWASTEPDLWDKLPVKIFTITGGLSYQVEDLRVDFGLYVHPVMSYFGETVFVAPLLSASWSF